MNIKRCWGTCALWRNMKQNFLQARPIMSFSFNELCSALLSFVSPFLSFHRPREWRLSSLLSTTLSLTLICSEQCTAPKERLKPIYTTTLEFYYLRCFNWVPHSFTLLARYFTYLTHCLKHTAFNEISAKKILEKLSFVMDGFDWTRSLEYGGLICPLNRI